ncbi:MAG: zonular occludens toxin domain-containing protein [Pseudomonadota bacterium]
MTIELQTGLPGSGKTLFTIKRVEELHKKTSRPVFYSGIAINKEKLAHWTEIKAEDWHKCPPESIVLIDECQRLFRPRANGSAVPEYESQLETHRHGGIDLILITQGPRLVSVNVRELVGRHFHSVRRWGMELSTIHEWHECRFNTQSRADSIKHHFKFDKSIYDLYKSAEAHTIKRNIPMKMWIFLAVIVLAPALFWYTFKMIEKKSKPAEVAGVAAPGVVASAASVSRRGFDVESYRPRVLGLAYTAPAYDEVTRPVRAPIPAACVSSKNRCQCYTQQGTKLEVPAALCAGIVEGGFFVAWDEKRGERIEANRPPALATKSDEPLPGLINITPGYTPPVVNRRVSDQVADGENLRHGKNNRIPG